VFQDGHLSNLLAFGFRESAATTSDVAAVASK
jgi:hypothetical protein